MTSRNVHRAACTAALYELERDGYLEGLTLQQIADLLELGHRSTAMRYLNDARQLAELVPELKEKILKRVPLKEQAPE